MGLKGSYLEAGLRLVLIYGSLNIAFAIVVPLLAHLLFPQPFVFVQEDEVFTGVSWDLILALSQKLGLWLLFQMDTARGMMLGLGIMTVAVALKGLKKGETWALASIFLSGVAGGVPFWTFTALYFQKGLYEGTSGVSLGIWLTLIFYLPWAGGLVLSGIGIRERKKAGPAAPTASA